MNKKKVIELLHKYGQESEMFKPFITEDEFNKLADDIIKILICKPVEQVLPSDKEVEKESQRDYHTWQWQIGFMACNKWIKNKIRKE